MTTLELRIFGLPATVEIPLHRAQQLTAQWSWCLPTAAAQRTVVGISGEPVTPPEEGGLPLLQRPDLDDDPSGHAADYRLTTALTASAISACAGELVMFHAAGVVDRQTGRVAGLIAPSGTGKTTAARTLCENGTFGYVTDETLVLNDRGEVMPYPKPLSVIISDSPEPGKSQHGPEELGFVPPPSGTLTLGPLIVLDRVLTDTPPTLTPMSVIEGLKTTLPQSSGAPLIPNCLDVLAELARRGGGFHRLTYSEISRATDEVGRAFTREPASRDWVHIPGTWPTGLDAPSRYGYTPQRSTAGPLTSHTLLQRAPFVDAIMTEDRTEALLLVGDLPIHLRGIGAQSWQYLSTQRRVSEVLAHCLEVFGAHPDAEELVLEALGQLEEGGVLMRAGTAAEPARPAIQ